jgi:hypothetical protein
MGNMSTVVRQLNKERRRRSTCLEATLKLLDIQGALYRLPLEKSDQPGAEKAMGAAREESKPAVRASAPCRASAQRKIAVAQRKRWAGVGQKKAA